MSQNQFQILFQDAFDTFKVFHAITQSETGCAIPKAPKTIWQILNHLIAWQEYQLGLLHSVESVILNEESTWIIQLKTDSQDELEKAVLKFDSQIQQIKNEVINLNSADLLIFTKLKVLQDLSVHLSFHIGEIILMRRMMGTYPLPQEMKEFLK